MTFYRPLPDFATIKESPIEGLGLYAKKNIAKDTIIGVTHVKNELFENGYMRTPLGGFYNHSETPNAVSIFCNDINDIIPGKIVNVDNNNNVNDSPKYRYMVSLRTIGAGEEITLKYNLYDPSV